MSWLTKEEAIAMLDGKLQEVEDTCNEIIAKIKTKRDYSNIIWDLSEEIEHAKKRARELRGDEREVYEYVRLEPLKQKLKQVQNEMNRKFKVYQHSGMTIDEAKAIPILTILDSYNIKHENTYGNRCKFKLRKDERTPSAVAYLDQNTFWDYGIQSGGSNIDLVMSLDKCDFKTALKTLASFV